MTVCVCVCFRCFGCSSHTETDIVWKQNKMKEMVLYIKSSVESTDKNGGIKQMGLPPFASHGFHYCNMLNVIVAVIKSIKE